MTIIILLQLFECPFKRPHEGSEVQESTADDLDSDPRGSGENNNEQDNTLGSVHVHRLDYHINNK